MQAMKSKEQVLLMQKIDAASPDAKSADLVAENIAALKALFPELLSERIVDGQTTATINVDVLKGLVGDATVTDAEEKYGLNWHGKRRARQLALTPSTGTLRPFPEESVDWDTTQNLVIEGDNLEVLKLLQRSYAGKVKLIYIDPPYNTGSDFVYPDNFQDNIKNYLELTGQIEGGQQIASNTESSGRFHTEWMNMMYPRLKAAWSLLRSDGFLIASVDDGELANLKTLMSDLFGEENFVSVLVFDRNRKNDAKLVSVGHEYMIVFAKDRSLLKDLDVKLRSPKEGVDEVRTLFEQLRREHKDDWVRVAQGIKAFYSSIDPDDLRYPLTRFAFVDERGPYRIDGDPSWPGGGGPRYDVPHNLNGRPCKVPSRGWVWPTYVRMKEEIDAGNIVFGVDEKTIPSVRRNLFEKDEQVMRSVIFSYAQKASQDFAALFDGRMVFQNPKSYLDIQRLVEYYSKPGDLILDFFAGSGTTGHGAMLASQSGAKSRRYILVQLPEPLDADNREQALAAELCDQLGRPRNIAELTKERLRRAGTRVRAASPLFPVDTGFRVFKLDSSNIRAWNPNRDDLNGSLLDNLEHIQPGRTDEDVLYEILLKLGLDLCVPIELRSVARAPSSQTTSGTNAESSFTVHSIGGGVLMACLDASITVVEAEPLALGIVEWHKSLAPAGDTTCIFRDSAFENDVAKSNLAAILEQHGIKQVRSL